MKNILVLQVPNLNMIGSRETNIYGNDTAENIALQVIAHAENIGFGCKVYQSNHEGEIIDFLQSAKRQFDAIIINAGAFTHYSIAIYDAILCAGIPVVEVHMTNIYKREEFRQKSVIAPACVGQITGFGKDVYFLALDALKMLLLKGEDK